MSIDIMCTSKNSISNEKAQGNKSSVDTIRRSKLKGSKEQDSFKETDRIDTDVLEAKTSIELSTSSESSCSSPPYIPFSNTFGKSETSLGKKPEKLRLSLDSQKSSRRHLENGKRPLRRRARSSEGYVLRHKMIDYFEEDSQFDENQSTKLKGPISTDIPLVRMENEIRRRNINRRISPKNMHGSSISSCDKPTKDRHRSVIPIEHPIKIGWDVMTVILSVAHTYLTHMAIRDRRFEPSPFISFCQAWFLIDILLNFFTERKTNTGEIISDPRRIVARYLTSWFVVDILSLFPWEVLYVKPLIEVQNRRGFFKKSFFRSKAVVRVTSHLRGKHFRWFGTVTKHTKHHGIGAQRLLRLLIKYVPKYIMFLRNMKGVVAVRILRFVHWSRRSIKNIESKPADASNQNKSSPRESNGAKLLSGGDFFEIQQRNSFEYDWENIDDNDDDDGVPM